MGSCFGTKNKKSEVLKGNKISAKRVYDEQEITDKVRVINVKSKANATLASKEKNYFYAIQRKTWINILDYLPYKDLCQAGQLNK
jgi:hypothetical protein